MSFIPDDYELPPVRLTLKTTERRSGNPKAPALGGFLAVSLSDLDDIREHIKASGKQSLFLSVALWSARDTRYVHEGNVSVSTTQATSTPSNSTGGGEREPSEHELAASVNRVLNKGNQQPAKLETGDWGDVPF